MCQNSMPPFDRSARPCSKHDAIVGSTHACLAASTERRCETDASVVQRTSAEDGPARTMPARWVACWCDMKGRKFTRKGQRGGCGVGFRKRNRGLSRTSVPGMSPCICHALGNPVRPSIHRASLAGSSHRRGARSSSPSLSLPRRLLLCLWTSHEPPSQWPLTTAAPASPHLVTDLRSCKRG